MLQPLSLPHVFSARECAEIIRIAGAQPFDDAGLVRGERYANIRRAQIAWLDEAGEGAWIYSRLVDTVIEANREHFGFELTEFAEKMQVAWYDASAGGHFDWHVDRGDGLFAGKRKLSFVVQLSDDQTYEGGALDLNGDGEARAVSRALGSGILFPSFVLHRVAPVTKGFRYSLTTWVHGPEFR